MGSGVHTKALGHGFSGFSSAYPYIGSEVVPFCGVYLDSYKVNPERNYKGA